VNIKSAWLHARERERYWQTIPLRAYTWVVLSAFLLFFSLGVQADPFLTWTFRQVLVQGAFGMFLALGFAAGIRTKRARFVFVPLLLLLVFVLQNFQPKFFAHETLMGPGFVDIRRRLAMSIVASSLGYVIFVLFAGTQGVRHVRVRTELELAERLQQTLAPPLAISNAGYEIQGRSVPSSEMGGDLLDAVDHHGAMACYLADVAGHGIQAGVFMGMVKSSARTALLRPGPLEQLLADLNSVLFGLKAGSATYATFACLRCGEEGRVEYSLAGSGPILHYNARSKTVSHVALEQFPLGLFASATFQGGSIEVNPGDVLVLLTDGLPEVADRHDEQFGIDRIEEIVRRNADGPLADLTDALFAAVRRHGSQTDDETLVLVRAR
jgi:hypothetical protein